ncbi:MAG: DoxX family protein [Chthoniobacterales bacterium]|nr:DoxX family protein [Chthoniobacterales bacterium]
MLRDAAIALVQTQSGSVALVARLVLAIVMLPHGLQKTAGWFGGYGFSGTMQFFTATLGIPWVLALAAILAETIGPIALAAGFATRVGAAAIGTNMVVAALIRHLENGFFMDWFHTQPGEGIEYHLLAVALCAVVFVLGGGTASVDRHLTKKFTRH